MINNTTNKIALILQTIPFVSFITAKWHVQDPRHSPVKASHSYASLSRSRQSLSLVRSIQQDLSPPLLPFLSQQNQISYFLRVMKRPWASLS